MAQTILITGGARSGKSAFAERLALSLGQVPLYIATAEAHDSEMAARIDAHRRRRGQAWATREAPLDLVGALDASNGQGPRLVDCLTLWLSNLMLAERDWTAEAAALVACLGRQRAPTVLVTNEVGDGTVPANALARAFRDAAGLLNQRAAEACDTVFLCVAGQPLRIKPNDHGL